MDTWAWLIWTTVFIAGTLAAIAGGLLAAFAIAGQRRAVRFAHHDEPHGACDCCGYELAGLEHGFCPECGWTYAGHRKVPVWPRLRAAAAGLALMVIAGAAAVSPHVARYGALSLLPSRALIAALPLAAVEGPTHLRDTELHRVLRGRSENESLTLRERRALAARCAAVLDSHRGDRTRAAAAELLVGVAADAPDHAAFIFGGLNDPSATVRRHVVDALAAMAMGQAAPAQAQAVQRLMGAAMCDGDELVRRQAIDALGRLPVDAAGAAGIYARAVRDPSPMVRARALYSLYARTRAAAPHERELAAVTIASRDQRADVREAAVYAMSRFAERLDAAVLLLGLSLRDASPDVRQSAASCLARLGPKAAPVWASLVASLEDEDLGVRAAAAEALGALGS